LNRHGLLERPSRRRADDFLAAVERSRSLHGPWVSPPRDLEAFEAYLRRLRRKDHLGYWIVTESGELAGAVHVSGIMMGVFRSGYLDYYAFLPHAGSGSMTRGLRAVLDDLFGPRGLHRVEANLQPGNHASRALVRRLGFRQEGFSPRYLRIGGEWRDHERWALTAEEWPAADDR
jgi:ribosomal-protein-alanine N-acetyltransferase